MTSKSDFDIFSDKMSSLNLFFMLALASMHVISIWELYYTSRDTISDFMAGVCYSSMTYFFFMSGFWLFRKICTEGLPEYPDKESQDTYDTFLYMGRHKDYSN